jgi:hypothetical protein
MDFVESIRAWRENHIIDRGAQIEGIEEIESLTIETLDSAMPEGDDPKDVVNRLKDLERKLYAQITAAKEYLSKHNDAKLSRPYQWVGFYVFVSAAPLFPQNSSCRMDITRCLTDSPVIRMYHLAHEDRSSLCSHSLCICIRHRSGHPIW